MSLYKNIPEIQSILRIPGCDSEALKEHLSKKPANFDEAFNLSLFFQKGLVWWEINGSLMLDNIKRPEINSLLNKLNISNGNQKEKLSREIRARSPKREHLEDVISYFENCIPKEIYKYLLKRHFCSLQPVEIFQAETNSRLLVGHTSDNPVETGIQFHRLYGFPFIPGSAIKGVALAGFLDKKDLLSLPNLNRLDLELSTARLNQLSNKFPGKFSKKILDDLCILFGIPQVQRKKENPVDFAAQQGRLIFLDAWPQHLPRNMLDLDSWTVHYPKYYNKNDFPGDNQDPTPLLQIAVSANKPFIFGVAWNQTFAEEASKKSKYLQQGIKYLQHGLSIIGIGSKTSSGYGYFENFQVINQFCK